MVRAAGIAARGSRSLAARAISVDANDGVQKKCYGNMHQVLLYTMILGNILFDNC
jgi:hypothetical protein